jgi:DNA polymerase-3 subunit delta'
MPDLASLLADLPAWRDWVASARSGRTPQATAAILPSPLHREFARLFASFALCEAASPPDACPGCRAWSSEGHPDLILLGGEGEAPGIDLCRRIPFELGLAPVAARRRIVVVGGADRLSLPASNSLLKIAEEPPEGGILLFVAERNAFLPTLASRLRFVVLPPEGLRSPSSPPRSDEEWLTWIERRRRATTESLVLELRSWIDHALETGMTERARELETLRLVAEGQRLPAPMVVDLAFGLLKEGLSCESLFGSVWET